MSRSREPLFNAPWPPLALIGALFAAYGLQILGGGDLVAGRWGFSPTGFFAGERAQLFTHAFLHGGWGHLLINGAGVLAFGVPVARLLGEGGRGALIFALFFLITAAAGALGFAWLHRDAATVLIGASGGASGLMAAASRLIAGRGRLGAILSGPVVAMAAAIVVLNLLVAVLGFAPGSGGAPVAWEAHLFGYAAGLLLIGPAARLAGRR